MVLTCQLSCTKALLYGTTGVLVVSCTHFYATSNYKKFTLSTNILCFHILKQRLNEQIKSCSYFCEYFFLPLLDISSLKKSTYDHFINVQYLTINRTGILI